MALIRGAYGGGQIKGSVSGTTFQQGPYGTIARNRTVPVNPQSARQQRARNAMAYASNEWFNTLTAGQRAAWEQYAIDTPWINKFGDTVTLPGRQHYLRRATLQYSILSVLGQPIAIDADAPSEPGLPANMDLTLAAEATGGTVDVDALTPALVASEALIIEYAVNVSPARNYYTGPYQLTSALVGVQTPPVNLLTGSALTVGYQVRARARWIDDAGRTSGSSYAETIIVT